MFVGDVMEGEIPGGRYFMGDGCAVSRYILRIVMS